MSQESILGIRVLIERDIFLAKSTYSIWMFDVLGHEDQWDEAADLGHGGRAHQRCQDSTRKWRPDSRYQG